ncbi:MAG: hypothetical protein GW763_08800 [Paraglaciecola sp.]|nr:hypothetical protein [Paraglaciecola sp.]NCT48071.1 hypothetical protein [Paraglaciecola sp.]
MKRLFSKLFKKKNNCNTDLKVKLVAIAKDEAAYLVDWIFHHIYMGFDEIDIYVNNTSDNTHDLANKFASNKTVNFLDGDVFFEGGKVSPQIDIYKHAFKKAKINGFSHVMFLDIDEFWMTRDFSVSIKNFIVSLSADVYCFQWLNKTNESTPFSNPFAKQIKGLYSRQIKSLVKTDINFEKINPHGVFDENLNYILADGKKYTPLKEDFSKVPDLKRPFVLADFFILHRMYRSEIEYVAMLARGRPIQNRKDIGLFKNNRNGYELEKYNIEVQLLEEDLATYESKKYDFIAAYNLAHDVEVAQAYIRKKRHDVTKLIETAPYSEANTLKKVLKNVHLDDVKSAYKLFLQRHSSMQ